MINSVIKPYSCLSEAIYARVGRRGVADWLYLLADYLCIPREVMIPEKIVADHNVIIPGSFLSLTLRHPHAEYDERGDKQRWYLLNAIFTYPLNDESGWILPTVLDMDVKNITPERIENENEFDMTPLTDDEIARGYRRQSIFMDDARVVEITWRDGMTGIERIWVTFLGRELDYSES